MLSIVEFCNFCGISRATFYRQCEDGKGPALTRIGSRVLIAKTTAEEWLKSLEEKQVTEAA